MEINVPKWLRVDEIISSKTKKRKSVYLSACTAWFIVNELKSIALYYSRAIESTPSCLDGKPCCTFDMYRACNNTTLSIASLDSLDFLHHSFFSFLFCSRGFSVPFILLLNDSCCFYAVIGFVACFILCLAMPDSAWCHGMHHAFCKKICFCRVNVVVWHIIRWLRNCSGNYECIKLF